MNSVVRSYHSKVLLFGEYLILDKAQALAIPYAQFNGRWQHVDNPEINNPYFKDLLSLVDFFRLNRLDNFIDVDRFEHSICLGQMFVSNIKKGYGTGSSGALIASIYDQFLRPDFATSDFALIRHRLSEMEACFHGKSSGVDPLISYFDQALLVDNDGVINKVDLPEETLQFYLLDSGVSRSTQPLVEIFNNKRSSDVFRKTILDPLKKISDQAVEQFLTSDKALFKTIGQLSRLQYEGFEEMILPEFRSIWKTGLESNSFYLKLCGAGGGGYYLAIGSKEEINKQFKGKVLRLF
jgi:mevalonate kinase